MSHWSKLELSKNGSAGQLGCYKYDKAIIMMINKEVIDFLQLTVVKKMIQFRLFNAIITLLSSQTK